MDAQNATGLLVARFQLEGHGQVVGQPQRQVRQRPTDVQRVSPRPEVPGIPLTCPATRGGVQLGRQQLIGLPE